MKFDITTLCVGLAAFVPVFALLVAAVIERRGRRRSEKPPQQEKLLRPPGHSLGLRLEEIQDKMLNDILIACLLCAIAGACGVTLGSFLGAHAPILWSGLAGALFVVFACAGAWAALRAFRRLKEGRNIRLGLRGEQVVAETLHEVADCGYRIFHDLPGGENWNIDHVAAGTRGVFLIETKARRRRASRKRQPEHVVVYDGKSLRFPSGDDTKAIPQAQDNARWLAEWLTRKTAEPVTVEPLIVVPGWYVEPKGNFPVKAMNATYLAGYLRGQREKVEPAQARRIIAALDEKCRDVEF
jgi:membrane protein implicated in regulation of membrane protease activity